MFKKSYKIKSIFIVIPHSQDRVEFRSGVWNSTSIFIEDHEKKGKLYSVINALKQKVSSSDVSKKCHLPVSEVEAVIDHLLQMNVLEDKVQDDLDRFLTSYMPIFSERKISSELQKPVLLLGDEALTRNLRTDLEKVLPPNKIRKLDKDDLMYQELKTLKTEDWLYDGVNFFEKVSQYESWKDFFIVLAFANINTQLAKNLNIICHELNISWIQIALDGPFLIVGPTFHGEESPCYECFENRIMMNLREHSNYCMFKAAIADRKISFPEAEINPVLLSLLSAHGTIEIINNVVASQSFTTRKMLGIYLPTMEISFNEILALSSCRVCGATQHRTDEQLYFDIQTQLKG